MPVLEMVLHIPHRIKLILDGINPNLAECCGAGIVDTIDELCCNDNVVVNPYGASGSCCGDIIINTDTTICCGSEARNNTDFICCGELHRINIGLKFVFKLKTEKMFLTIFFITLNWRFFGGETEKS